MLPAHEKDGESITMRLLSPTGNAERDLMIWVDEFPTPSLEFGPSHCHESADESGFNTIVSMVKLIIEDRLVLATEINGINPDYTIWLNLSDPDVLADELTDTCSSGHMIIKSWTGSADREVRLSDISL